MQEVRERRSSQPLLELNVEFQDPELSTKGPSGNQRCFHTSGFCILCHIHGQDFAPYPAVRRPAHTRQLPALSGLYVPGLHTTQQPAQLRWVMLFLPNPGRQLSMGVTEKLPST